MFYFYEKEKIEDLEVMAKLHGAKKKGKSSGATEEGGIEIKDDAMMFRSPDDYKHLSKAERVALTQQMKQKHKGIQFLGGKNG